MKKLVAVFSLASLVLLWSCKDDPVIGDASSKLKGIDATWEVDQVIQSYSTLTGAVEWDVTYYYKTDAAQMEVMFDSDNLTYSVSAEGMKNFFGIGGSWAYDNDEFPSQITFNEGSANELVVPLGAIVREVDEKLHLIYERGCGTETYIKYDFYFTRKS